MRPGGVLGPNGLVITLPAAFVACLLAAKRNTNLDRDGGMENVFQCTNGICSHNYG